MPDLQNQWNGSACAAGYHVYAKALPKKFTMINQHSMKRSHVLVIKLTTGAMTPQDRKSPPKAGFFCLVMTAPRLRYVDTLQRSLRMKRVGCSGGIFLKIPDTRCAQAGCCLPQVSIQLLKCSIERAVSCRLRHVSRAAGCGKWAVPWHDRRIFLPRRHPEHGAALRPHAPQRQFQGLSAPRPALL